GAGPSRPAADAATVAATAEATRRDAFMRAPLRKPNDPRYTSALALCSTAICSLAARRLLRRLLATRIGRGRVGQRRQRKLRAALRLLTAEIARHREGAAGVNGLLLRRRCGGFGRVGERRERRLSRSAPAALRALRCNRRVKVSEQNWQAGLARADDHHLGVRRLGKLQGGIDALPHQVPVGNAVLYDVLELADAFRFDFLALALLLLALDAVVVFEHHLLLLVLFDHRLLKRGRQFHVA